MLDPFTYVKAQLIAFIGVPVLCAILVGSVITYYDCWTRFGLEPWVHLEHGLALGFSALALFITIRAWHRTLVNPTQTVAPITMKLTPMLVLVGMAFGVWFALRIRENRINAYDRTARSMCAQALCPETRASSSWSDEVECKEKRRGFSKCEVHAWACQVEVRAFEERKAAGDACLAQRLKR
ncbi:MAG: hypothetical protein AAF654_10120 [Myxococcota bacterium]